MKLNKRVELLAPAKDKETAIAAINSGADAVYVGAVRFGARHNAGNSLEDIKEIVDYAHIFNVRVHVTMNTILTDEELEKSVELINRLYEIGVDAIIVQDMGIFNLAVRGKLPPIEIHASTQCDNRTLEKVKFFQEMGVKRVILARELTIDQIERICYEVQNAEFNEDMEIETFIHGALCVSYSGQCYLSASIGGRSANRGECAQACRKKYTLVDEDGNVIAKDKYLLSLKDFNGSKHLERLIKAGVKSFKVEGRLKDINYVKNVVAFYRKEIDKLTPKTSYGKVFADFEPDVNKSFNRGFTDYFLACRGDNAQNPRRDRTKDIYNFETPKSMGEKLGRVEKIGKDYFVVKGAEIRAQDGLCFLTGGGLEGFLVNKVEGGKVFPNRMPHLKVGTELYRNFDCAFDKLLNNSATKRRIGVTISYSDGVLKAIDDNENVVRVAVEFSEPAKNPEKMLETFKTQLSKLGESEFYLRNIKIKGEIGFMPVSMVNELRRNLLEKLVAERLKNYKRPVQNPLEYAEFPLEKYDYRANVLNETAKDFYESSCCEISEFAPEKTKNFEGKELMRTKHCLKFAFDMCKSPKKLFLIDDKGKKYSLRFDCANCEMVITDV